MPYEDPLERNAGLDIYERPIKDHTYIVTVDTSRGISSDYSAFTVMDVTQIPYVMVAKYRNNEVKPMLFPNIIFDICKAYNKAYALIEVNDIGGQVADILHFDLEYDNILMCSMRGRSGQVVGSGFSGKKAYLGVRMTKAVKKLGCSNFKTMLEDDKIVIKDYDTISELTTFIQVGDSFQAEEGCNDDLAMCFVMFCWLTTSVYFKELVNSDIRQKIYEDQREAIEADMAPFGFVEDGTSEESFVDNNGDRWYVDEYGDRAFQWNYVNDDMTPTSW